MQAIALAAMQTVVPTTPCPQVCEVQVTPQTCIEEKAADIGGASAGQAPMRSRMEALAGVMVLTRASGGLSIGGCWPNSFCIDRHAELVDTEFRGSHCMRAAVQKLGHRRLLPRHLLWQTQLGRHIVSCHPALLVAAQPHGVSSPADR